MNLHRVKGGIPSFNSISANNPISAHNEHRISTFLPITEVKDVKEAKGRENSQENKVSDNKKKPLIT